MAEEQRRRVEDWLHLTEIHIPKVKSSHETGVIYWIVDLGGVEVGAEACHQAGLPLLYPPPSANVLLPTVTVDYGQNQATYRLPLPLADWAAQFLLDKTASLPLVVEFRMIAGQYTAALRDQGRGDRVGDA